MSVKWMALIWESDLKGPELLMALAIADHADTDGRCFPGIDRLADKTKLQRRQVQDLIRRLQTKQILRIETGNGRGHKNIFQFIERVQVSTPFTQVERVQFSAPITDEKGCRNVHEKGAVLRTERVQDPALHIDNHHESSKEPKKAAKPTKISPTLKTRPELDDKAWLAGLASDAENRGIDIVALYERMLTWCEKRSVTPTRLRLLNWLDSERKQVPVSYVPRPASSMNGNGRQVIVEPVADAALPPKPIKPSRAPDNCPPEERRVWRAVLDEIKRHINPDVYTTWFGAIVFDGFNETMDGFKLRAGQITKDWITSYYTELITDALHAEGLEEFTIEWEIEDEFQEQTA